MVEGGAESRAEEGLSHKTKPGYKLEWEGSPLYPVTRNPWMDALNLQATDAPSLWPYPTHML